MAGRGKGQRPVEGRGVRVKSEDLFASIQQITGFWEHHDGEPG